MGDLAVDALEEDVKKILSRWDEMVYRWARRGDIATQGEAAADDLHMVMDDRWQRTFWDVQRTTAMTTLQPHAAFCHQRVPRLWEEIKRDNWKWAKPAVERTATNTAM